MSDYKPPVYEADLRIVPLFRKTFGVARRNFFPLTGAALICAAAAVFIFTLLEYIPGWADAAGDRAVLIWFADAAIQLLIAAFFFGAVTHCAYADCRGGKARLRDMLDCGGCRIFPVFEAMLIVLLAFLFGLVFFVIPGFFILMMFLFAGHAAAVEGTGCLASLDRSRELTEGRRWPLFGFFAAAVTVFVLIPVAFFIWKIPAGWEDGDSSFMYAVVFAVIGLASDVLLHVFFTVLYHDLSVVKDRENAQVGRGFPC